MDIRFLLQLGHLLFNLDEILNTSSGSFQLQVKHFKTDFVACVRNFEFLGILGLKNQGAKFKNPQFSQFLCIVGS